MLSRILILSLFLFLYLPVNGQTLKGGGEVNPNLLTNRKSLAKWQDLRYGMFIHWGPVSIKGTEIGWSRGKEVPFAVYDSLYRQFNPTKFDAREWVSLIKAAGMKYLIFVSKHHDGFVMWDSKTTDYDITSTPYKKDILLAISRECEAQGILFGTYYSILDWRHPDYPLELNREGEKQTANMSRYIIYMKAQLKELVEKYHSKIMWFDGEWEDPWTHDMGMDLYAYVRSLDNEILINNRVDKGREGMEGTTSSDEFAGDFATPEQQIGRFDNVTPWESCITLCQQWSWKPNDLLKTKEECIQTLVRTVGGDGNLLLNIGPKPDGTIEKRQADRLMEIGDWLKTNGNAIYGTRGGPLPPLKWGSFTNKNDNIYIHLLNNEERLVLNRFEVKPKSIETLLNKTNVKYRTKDTALRIYIPENEFDGLDLILELTLEKQ